MTDPQRTWSDGTPIVDTSFWNAARELLLALASQSVVNQTFATPSTVHASRALLATLAPPPSAHSQLHRVDMSGLDSMAGVLSVLDDGPRLRWVPASDPPKHYRPVLVWLDHGGWRRAHFDLDTSSWVSGGAFLIDDKLITHWAEVEGPRS